MSETHIEIDKVNAYYSGNHALKNISVKILKKQITAIIGPSGCGKSTLLKCMNRLIDLTDGVTHSGRILIDNEDIFDRKTDIVNIRKKMGLLGQKPIPLPCRSLRYAYGPKPRIKEKPALMLLSRNT